MKARKKFLKDYFRNKIDDISDNYKKCENIFLGIKCSELDKSNWKYLLMIFVHIIALVATVVNNFVYDDILQLGKALSAFIIYSMVAMIVWIIYLFCCCIGYKKCKSRKQRKEYVSSNSLKMVARIILLPIIIVIMITHLLKMEDTAEYHLANMVNLCIAVILAFVFSYKMVLYIGKISPVIAEQGTKALYIMMLLMVFAFFIIAYILNWIFFYCIFYNDYSYDLCLKDKCFSKMWNQEKQIIYLISIILMYVDYLDDSNNELVHGLTIAFIIVFALDTLKNNWK